MMLSYLFSLNLLDPVRSIMMYKNTDFYPICVKWSWLPVECVVCSLMRMHVVQVFSILLNLDLWLMRTPYRSDVL